MESVNNYQKNYIERIPFIFISIINTENIIQLRKNPNTLYHYNNIIVYSIFKVAAALTNNRIHRVIYRFRIVVTKRFRVHVTMQKMP